MLTIQKDGSPGHEFSCPTSRSGQSASTRRTHARAANAEARQEGCTRREITQHASRGIRPGGDGPYPGGETWRPIHEAGHSHWFVQGPKGRRQIGASQTGKSVSTYEKTSATRL